MLYLKDNSIRGDQEFLKSWWDKYGKDHSCCYKKFCSHCGDEFYSRDPKTKYCSFRCVNDAYILRRKVRKLLERKKVCPVCKQPFEAKRKDSMYCSSKCKQKAYRNRLRY